MRVVRTAAGVRRAVRAWRAAGETVAFVPTMGAFHEGHLSLMRLARRRAGRSVVSLFVNPAQFAAGEDLARYPRDERRDFGLARREGVDLMYAPAPEEVYAPDRRTEVRVRGIEDVWEGASRPGHFGGVALVVLKFLHRVEPDVLVLGRKDAQQVVILERMIRDLDLPVRVVRGDTVREPDGLAMSSRNAYLSPEDRRAAAALYRALGAGRAAARAGERSAVRLLARVGRVLAAEPRVRTEYAALVDPDTLEPVRSLAGPAQLLVAARVGGTRLIDNMRIVPGSAEKTK